MLYLVNDARQTTRSQQLSGEMKIWDWCTGFLEKRKIYRGNKGVHNNGTKCKSIFKVCFGS